MKWPRVWVQGLVYQHLNFLRLGEGCRPVTCCQCLVFAVLRRVLLMVDERLSSNGNYSTVILSTGRRMVSSVENSLAKTAIAVCFSALNSAE